ncbi:MAG: GtrA family protein [Lachnospiraceae bacterium]|nr:GtrA family protein [Lachnospiraceae bacterium]
MKDLIDKIMKKLMTREVITYLIAGVLTTIVNLAVSYLLYDVMKMDENLVTIIAWVVAVAFAYVINNLWVFRDKYVNLKTESIKVGKFVAARLFTYVVEAIGVLIFITKLECNFWVVKFVLIVIVTILNYFFSKFLIFLNPGNEKKNDPEKISETE